MITGGAFLLARRNAVRHFEEVEERMADSKRKAAQQAAGTTVVEDATGEDTHGAE
jgi:hypothetical protein